MLSVHNAYSGRQEFYSKEEAAAFLAIVKRKSLYSDTHPHLLSHYPYRDWRNGAGRAYELKAQEEMRHEIAQELGAIKAELAAMQRAYVARRMKAAVIASPARKYNPNQPRVPAGGENGGQWTSGGGGEGPGIMNPFSLIPGLSFLPPINLLSGLNDGLESNSSLTTPVFQLAGGFDDVNKSMSVTNFISEKCRASVRQRIDTPMFDLSLNEMLDLAKKGDPMAVRCKKILNENRFRK